MSDPSFQIRSAQTIKFGLLAARSSDAISRAVEQKELSLEDREILQTAQRFLRQVAEGAEFITNGAQSGGSAFGSTEALGYALRPIESLDMLKGREVPAVFEQLADAVRQIAVGGTSDLDVGLVNSARAFFDRLYASLLGLIEHNRLRPTSNGRRAILGQPA